MADYSLRDPRRDLPEAGIPAGVHHDLYRLWLDRWAPGRMPGRADFDPRVMPKLLPFLMLIDVERNPTRFRVRVMGTAIVDAMGMDSTGRYVDEIAHAEEPLQRHLRMAETPAPYFKTGVPIPWSPREYKTYAVLGLPLAADGHTVDMILMSLTFE